MLALTFHSSRSDPSTRRDRTERRVQGFAKQINNMVEAYTEWVYCNREGGFESGLGPSPQDTINAQGTRTIMLLDVYRMNSLLFLGIIYLNISQECRRLPTR
jgi:hypothetical protein